MASQPNFVPFSPPQIDGAEIEAVVEALRSGWLTTGPRTAEFESAFAAAVGAPAALAVNSGTAAMHVALAALGIGPGQAVVSTPMTFSSTIHVIEQVGARPVLADVEPDTLNIDPHEVEKAIANNSDVAAVLPVHYGGHPADMPALHDLAKRHDLAVIEDAAHALPAAAGQAKTGGVSGPRHAACFSFYATKNLTTGEGGMLTGSPELIEEARIWSLHGMSRDAWMRYEQGGAWFYEVVRAGFKYNLTDVAAAMGLVQLGKLENFHQRRTAISAQYTKAFVELDAIEAPTARDGYTHAWHLYPIRLRLDRLTIDRKRFIDELTERQIGTSVHFIPVHMHPYYRDRYGFRPDDFPVAASEYERIISLPIYPSLTDTDVQRVIDAVGDVATKHRR